MNRMVSTEFDTWAISRVYVSVSDAIVAGCIMKSRGFTWVNTIVLHGLESSFNAAGSDDTEFSHFILECFKIQGVTLAKRLTRYYSVDNFGSEIMEHRACRLLCRLLWTSSSDIDWAFLLTCPYHACIYLYVILWSVMYDIIYLFVVFIRLRDFHWIIPS